MFDGRLGNPRWLLCLLAVRPLQWSFTSPSLNVLICKMGSSISFHKIVLELNKAMDVMVQCI